MVPGNGGCGVAVFFLMIIIIACIVLFDMFKDAGASGLFSGGIVGIFLGIVIIIVGIIIIIKIIKAIFGLFN